MSLYDGNFLRVGVGVDDLYPSQKNLAVIDGMNKLVERKDLDTIVFFRNLSFPFIKLETSMMSFDEVSSFNGVIIATDIESARLALEAINTSVVYFFVDDLFWLRNKKDWWDNMKVMRNKNVKLIARSEEHKKLIENYCNNVVELIQNNLDIEEVVDYEIRSRQCG